MKPERMMANPALCAQCKEVPWEHRVDHVDWNYGFCSGCYQKYHWTCPDCQRSFWNGFNKGILLSKHHGPRHYRELDELDHRSRRKRVECEGWKSDGRKAADRYYGWHRTEYPKRAGPVIGDPKDLKRYPKYK